MWTVYTVDASIQVKRPSDPFLGVRWLSCMVRTVTFNELSSTRRWTHVSEALRALNTREGTWKSLKRPFRRLKEFFVKVTLLLVGKDLPLLIWSQTFAIHAFWVHLQVLCECMEDSNYLDGMAASLWSARWWWQACHIGRVGLATWAMKREMNIARWRL